jgi:hypothetical protein
MVMNPVNDEEILKKQQSFENVRFYVLESIFGHGQIQAELARGTCHGSINLYVRDKQFFYGSTVLVGLGLLPVEVSR